jgi:hypothetical protein
MPETDIQVGETPSVRDLLAAISEDRRIEIEREERRAEMAQKIAQYRWAIASSIHKLKDGRSKLNFDSHPFQPTILQDPATDMIIYGSAQWGKPAPNCSLIHTPFGWITMGDVKVGDLVSTIDGGSAPVTHVFDKPRRNIYRLFTNDGEWADAAEEHDWEVHDSHGNVEVMTTIAIDRWLRMGERLWLPDAKVGNTIEVKNRRIVNVQSRGETDCRCIMVDHPSHLYVTNNYIVTHNSEILIAHAMSSAGICGMNLIWVISKKEKRDKFVADRINPCIESNPHYRKMMETARVRGANADSTGLKHIGEGSINFVYATTENEFTTYSGTSVIVDEHQECPLVNLRQLDNRMSGTEWGYFMRVGHPDLEGTEENANLDYLYQMSDRRVWQVPCPFCKVPQELNWEDHVVAVTRNRSGGITKIVPRDQEWSPSSVLDMRPVCRECHAPMIRLTKRADWIATNPGISRHGYNLGNIYNPSPMCALSKLFERYLSARHSPNDMKEFYNKVLGKPFSMGTEKITEAMLGNCSTGEMTGVAPYRFVSISQMDWRRAEEIAAEAA